MKPVAGWQRVVVVCLPAVFGLAGIAVAAPQPKRLSPYTTITFQPDGNISEFIQWSPDDQEYFVVDPLLENPAHPNFGAIKADAILTPGVYTTRDNNPPPGAINGAGQSGFRDPPGSTGTALIPTGFNIGRVFAAYNPDAFDGEGAYFLAIDISAPAVMDSISGTVPVAFDVDGNGSRTTQTEIAASGTVSEAPTRVSQPDTYSFEIDADGDGQADLVIIIEERRDIVRFGAVPVDPGGVPQVINGVTVRRAVFVDDISGTLPDPPADLAVQFLDANDDGVFNHNDVGIGADVEILIRNVRRIPGNSDPACVTFLFLADSFDDEQLGGGAEESVLMPVEFAVPDIEVVKEGKCIDEPDSAFRHAVSATPDSIVEFRVAIENTGNRDLDVVLNDSLTCAGLASATLVPSSCVVTAAPLGFDSASFCDDFEQAASSSPGAFEVAVGELAGVTPCSEGLGDLLEFRFRVRMGPNVFDPSLCDEDVDCSNAVSVRGTTTELIDPILPPDQPTPDSPDGNAEEEDCADAACCGGLPGCVPNDGIGDVADEFEVTVVDNAGQADTIREAVTGDDNIVEIELECRGVSLDKRVRIAPSGPFFTLDQPLALPAAPFDLEYRYTFTNNGEVDEEGTISDGILCADVANLSALFPGEVGFGDCPLCEAPTPGELTAIVPAGGVPFVTSCVIQFGSQEAVRAFLGVDDPRSSCRAKTPSGDPDPDCYRNCSAVRAEAAEVTGVCPGQPVADESYATVCQDVCEIEVTKSVVCLDGCPDGSPVGTPADSIQAVPGACLQFVVTIENASPDTALCALEIADTLGGQPVNVTWTGTAHIDLNGTACTVPAGFNVSGNPFVLSPAAHCGVPEFAPGAVLTVTFDVQVPAGAAAGATVGNTAIARGAVLCPNGVPSLTCEGSNSATIHVRRPGVTCTSKEWSFAWDADADCEPDLPFSAFAQQIDLRDKVFPVLLELRIQAGNTGGVPLSVTVDDSALRDCIAFTEGVSFSEPPDCELGDSKNLNPLDAGSWICRVLVGSADAVRALDACDGVQDGAYINQASSSAVVLTTGGDVCAPPVPIEGSGVCEGRILVPPPCEMEVQKDVACSGDGEFVKDLETSAGATVTFRVRVTNLDSAVKLPQVCVTDTLSLGCLSWFVPGTVTADIDGDDVTACVQSKFDAAMAGNPPNRRACYTFGACRPSQPWLAPGETLTILFDASVPGSTSLSECLNNARVETYTEACEANPPADEACGVASSQANLDLLAPRLTCLKTACLDMDRDGNCDPGLPPSSSIQVPEALESFRVLYELQATNSGDAALTNVQICDHELFWDVHDDIGPQALGFCDLKGVLDGCTHPFTLAPGETAVRYCAVDVPNREAWGILAAPDGPDDPCPDAKVDPLNQCYSNCAYATGIVGSFRVCGVGAPSEITSNACEATVCTPTSVRIPTVSEWGLVILMLLLLTGWKVYFGAPFQTSEPR